MDNKNNKLLIIQIIVGVFAAMLGIITAVLAYLSLKGNLPTIIPIASMVLCFIAIASNFVLLIINIKRNRRTDK